MPEQSIQERKKELVVEDLLRAGDYLMDIPGHDFYRLGGLIRKLARLLESIEDTRDSNCEERKALGRVSFTLQNALQKEEKKND